MSESIAQEIDPKSPDAGEAAGTRTEAGSAQLAQFQQTLRAFRKGAEIWLSGCGAVFKREFFGYFRTPIAYVFMAVTLLALNGVAWSNVPVIGRFFQSENASLEFYFKLLFPWIYLILVPAIGMRLWAEERRSGTIEMLFTSPVTVAQAVVAKFFAAWAFILITLLMTFTMPLTTLWLGDPDTGPMLSGYLGAALMAGSYLGICSLASALTRNQVIAFVLGIGFCLALLLAGVDAWNGFLNGIGVPVVITDALANFSFIPHFDLMTKGLITLRSLAFFVGVTVAALSINALVLSRR